MSYLRQQAKGPAAARNMGARHARGRIIALTDSDALPARDWLSRIEEPFLNNPTVVAVEGMVYADNEGEFEPLNDGPSNKTGGIYLTCNCAYLRDALFRAGGFDESFPYAAYEDAELAARIQELGKIAWQPEAVVIHPERRLTIRSTWRKLYHWEYVFIMGRRYGYLAWKKYPAKYPGWHVLALSIIALPLAKFRKAFSWLLKRPTAALSLMMHGLIESIGALIIVFPRILLRNFRGKIERKNYLANSCLD
jgi:GT2 family glycosyltransferase